MEINAKPMHGKTPPPEDYVLVEFLELLANTHSQIYPIKNQVIFLFVIFVAVKLPIINFQFSCLLHRADESAALQSGLCHTEKPTLSHSLLR